MLRGNREGNRMLRGNRQLKIQCLDGKRGKWNAYKKQRDEIRMLGEYRDGNTMFRWKQREREREIESICPLTTNE